MAKVTPPEQSSVVQLERLLHDAILIRLAQAPVHVRRLGKILRRSVQTGRLDGFRRYLYRHRFDVAPEKIAWLRDYLIVRRIDLKDLEPAARARLRKRTLVDDDVSMMTDDYRAAGGSPLFCRGCRWFVTAPNDETEQGAKSCVELGTKGADTACYGYVAR